ncbi:hypothetical protein OIU78_015710 [Salix suchowensis]|nr:hypothetical protein OIU78_015710 [Salix suchowensis]
MGFIATSHGITLIHHHGLHFASVTANGDFVETPTSLAKPAGRECHNWYVIGMEFVVNSDGPPPSPFFLKLLRVRYASNGTALSHSDGPPPSPPASKLFRVRKASTVSIIFTGEIQEYFKIVAETRLWPPITVLGYKLDAVDFYFEMNLSRPNSVPHLIDSSFEKKLPCPKRTWMRQGSECSSV